MSLHASGRFVKSHAWISWASFELIKGSACGAYSHGDIKRESIKSFIAIMVLFIFIYLVWISICSHCMKDNLQSLWGLHTWKRTTNSHFFAKFVFLYIYTCMVSRLTLIYHLTADNNSSYDWLMILRFCQYNHQQFDSCVKLYWAIFIVWLGMTWFYS